MNISENRSGKDGRLCLGWRVSATRHPEDPETRKAAAGDAGRLPRLQAAWRLLLTEPARPRAIARRPDSHWFVVATVCIGAFMGQLDASIVTLALPTLRHGFHASLGAVEWVALAYLVVLVAGVTVVGDLADRAGRKLLYSYGFLVFIAGSFLAGIAPSLPLLVGARVLQGAGAAMLQANSVALIAQAMPPKELGRGVGFQGAAQALGLAAGPSVGGLLISLAGWRSIFFVSVPAGLLGAVLGWILLPRSRDLRRGEPFDWLGAMLFMPAVAALLAALSFGGELGWSSPPVVAMLGASALLAAWFGVHQARTPHSMLDLGLFRRPAFSAAVASGLLSYLVLFGTMFLIPFYLQEGQRLGPAAAGEVLTVLAVALALVAPIAGRVADRFGAGPPTVGGMLLTAATLAVFTVDHGGVGVVSAELAAVGIGLGLFTPANNAAIMGNAPRQRAGEASGILNMTRGLGTSLGVALTGLALGGAAAGAGAAVHAQAVPGAGILLASTALAAAVISALRRA